MVNAIGQSSLLRDGLDASGHKNRFEKGAFINQLGRYPKSGLSDIDIRNPDLWKTPPTYSVGGPWVNVYC